MSVANQTVPACEVKDLNLKGEGKARIEWSERDMPVLRQIRERFKKEQPFKGLRVSCCAHITTEPLTWH